jgi:predicted nuclease of restriction endonuclease-like (RecB) superfamily
LQTNYIHILDELKSKIRESRVKAAFSVNVILLKLYWDIGKIILEQQKIEGWGAKIIDTLARDLKMEFPDFKGLSIRNLKYMRTFAEAYPSFDIIVQPALAQIQSTENQKNKFVQPAVAQIPWTHHILILSTVKEEKERIFYIEKTIQNGWSKSILALQINNKLHLRQGNAITNFATALPAPQSDLAIETLKSPYIFDFLSLSEELKERELENALVQHLKKFMLELGRGFSYVGNQKNLNVKGDDFFLDLLFYNYHLDCFVVFELKVGDFKPEYAGKLNFYVNTVNEQIKSANHKPTIGVLLCKTPNETVVKYSLIGIESPIGVADYELKQSLPKQLKGEIPTIEEFEAEIEKEYEELKSPGDKKLARIKEMVNRLNSEGLKEIKSPESIKKIFDHFLLAVKNRVLQLLDPEIATMFQEIKTVYWLDNTGYNTEAEITNALISNNSPYKISLEIRLNAFKKAGTNVFGVYCSLEGHFKDYKYAYSHTGKKTEEKIEMLYHQLPTSEEINHIAQKCYERILNDIEENLQRIDPSE